MEEEKVYLVVDWNFEQTRYIVLGVFKYKYMALDFAKAKNLGRSLIFPPVEVLFFTVKD